MTPPVTLRLPSVKVVTEMPEKTYPRFRQPLVGITGTGNSLVVVHSDEGFVCQLSFSTQLFLLIGCFVAGPGLSAMLWWKNAEIHQHPLIVGASAWTISVVFAFAFAYYALKSPRLKVSRANRTLAFHSWRVGPPSWTLAAAEIDTVEVSEQSFLNEGERFLNFVVSVVSAKGDVVPLCVSTDPALIASLKRDLQDWAATGRWVKEDR